MVSNILNLCLLWGTIQFQNISYGIEPVEAVPGFVHVVYESTNENIEIPVLQDESYNWYNESQLESRSNAKYPKGLSLESYSVIVAQLLSIGMGLTYDSTDTCHCTGEVCLMTPKAIYFGGMKDFSTCSLDEFKYLSTGRDLGCLQDWPMERSFRRRPRRICGNGILEGNEQCDCGTLKNCTHRACCDPMSCRLKKNAICGSGECCKQDCTVCNNYHHCHCDKGFNPPNCEKMSGQFGSIDDGHSYPVQG
ncbi:disintegrin and metallopeptidase domain 5 [Cricetulus griseus]